MTANQVNKREAMVRFNYGDHDECLDCGRFLKDMGGEVVYAQLPVDDDGTWDDVLFCDYKCYGNWVARHKKQLARYGAEKRYRCFYCAKGGYKKNEIMDFTPEQIKRAIPIIKSYTGENGIWAWGNEVLCKKCWQTIVKKAESKSVWNRSVHVRLIG